MHYLMRHNVLSLAIVIVNSERRDLRPRPGGPAEMTANALTPSFLPEQDAELPPVEIPAGAGMTGFPRFGLYLAWPVVQGDCIMEKCYDVTETSSID